MKINHIPKTNLGGFLEYRRRKSTKYIISAVIIALISLYSVQPVLSELGPNQTNDPPVIFSDSKDSSSLLQDISTTPVPGQESNPVTTSENNLDISVDSYAKNSNTENANNSASISINSSQEDNSSTEIPESAVPTVVINGESITLPDNGRLNQRTEDENTETRIRADIDSEGSSSIRISTETNIESELE